MYSHPKQVLIKKNSANAAGNCDPSLKALYSQMFDFTIFEQFSSFQWARFPCIVDKTNVYRTKYPVIPSGLLKFFLTNIENPTKSLSYRIISYL